MECDSSIEVLNTSSDEEEREMSVQEQNRQEEHLEKVISDLAAGDDSIECDSIASLNFLRPVTKKAQMKLTRRNTM